MKSDRNDRRLLLEAREEQLECELKKKSINPEKESLHAAAVDFSDLQQKPIERKRKVKIFGGLYSKPSFLFLFFFI
ncbi:hypothetical protein A946_01210 [Methylacidiphilum kamchatkense Kam1]|uniref:Uncharacterized protein n=1 Tax=Methylacidiphilum kamchatkense Kam1 TaxID=1202785 RepID=A0ABR4ZYW5_9BACT|nr:hypothetical protein A946_01210 [Methylacidiphilum kamchatkense Kam1]